MLRRTFVARLLPAASIGLAAGMPGFGLAAQRSASASSGSGSGAAPDAARTEPARDPALKGPIEEQSADVVVVGSGAAGLSAGLAALEAGAKNVVILEKSASAGGHTILSSGSVTAVEPEHVAALEQAMLEAGGGLNNPELVRTLARQSWDAHEWLAHHGVSWTSVPFRAVGSPGAWSYSTGSAQAGYDYVQCLLQAFRRRGGRMLFRTQASSLLFVAPDAPEGAGGSESVMKTQPAVAGIFASRPMGQNLLIRTKAVVIASGGFTANKAMVAAFRPDIDPDTPTTANPHKQFLDGSTGDGILMAQRAGAKLVDMNSIEVVPFTGGRLTDYVGGEIWLNSEGRRFVSEGASFDIIRERILEQPNSQMWAISDVKSSKGATLPVKLMSGTVASADTIEDLARGIGVPVSVLKNTLERWNRSVRDGWDKDFDRPIPEQGQTIDAPPYFYGEEFFSIHYTCGGIAINAKAQTLDRQGLPIPGLFAAGETTGGVHGKSRLGGCGLLDCFVFGRIAGIEAAGLAARGA